MLKVQKDKEFLNVIINNYWKALNKDFDTAR
jgi:hypothetical protein